MVVYAWKANICDFRRYYSAEVIPYANLAYLMILCDTLEQEKRQKKKPKSN